MPTTSPTTLTLDEAVATARTGDVWVFRGRSVADRAIQAATNSPVNHVGMAVALDDAVPGERRKAGIGILDQLERSRCRADLGDRGSDGGRKIDAARDRALHLVAAGRDDVDEIGIDQER